jgi:hypothetical protein
MRGKYWPFIAGPVILFGVLFIRTGSVRAATSYGNGYYTNLCDSGTAATYYNCDPGCNPQTGSCSSTNDGVVKWVCQGKWNQCLEWESQWSNYEQIDTTGCGYTVQLSLFDKKCRRDDGTWDNTCRLLGYMVWYSGDCWPGVTTPTAGPTPIPSSVPSPTPTVTATPTVKPDINPTAVTVSQYSNLAASGVVKPSPTPTAPPMVGVCGRKCQLAADCQAGFACVNNFCRNPACPDDTTCFCHGESASSSAVTKTSPSTGVETWLGMAGMAGLGVLGIRLKKWAGKVW